MLLVTYFGHNLQICGMGGGVTFIGKQGLYLKLQNTKQSSTRKKLKTQKLSHYALSSDVRQHQAMLNVRSQDLIDAYTFCVTQSAVVHRSHQLLFY